MSICQIELAGTVQAESELLRPENPDCHQCLSPHHVGGHELGGRDIVEKHAPEAVVGKIEPRLCKPEGARAATLKPAGPAQ